MQHQGYNCRIYSARIAIYRFKTIFMLCISEITIIQKTRKRNKFIPLVYIIAKLIRLFVIWPPLGFLYPRFVPLFSGNKPLIIHCGKTRQTTIDSALIKPRKFTNIDLVLLPGYFEQQCKILRQMRVTTECIINLMKKYCICCK